MSGFVRSERSGDTVTVTLCNPAKRNSLGLDVLLALTDAFGQAAETDATGVILAAEGPVFSAGHNFGEMKGAPYDDAHHLFTVCSNLMQMMHTVPQPIVARVHALATAAGCQLVASCDLAVAARSAGFAIPGGKGGLFCHTPAVAVARSMPRKFALEMAMTGDAIDADTAHRWGLVNRVVEDEHLDDAVHELLARATRGSAWSKGRGKKAFYEQVNMAEADAYVFASAVMAEAVTGDAAQEGIAAFLDKREPRFPR
ncbi:MAG: enoyl-CoA hydratase-related protein [Ilumatobacteraceae bacterium]